MKLIDGWWWPDKEEHMPEWMANPKNRMMLNGRSTYQGRKQIAVLNLCRKMGKHQLALDIGGHVGTWAFNMAVFFDEVVSFEPVLDHRECFKRNVTSPKVGLEPYALGDKVDKVSMHIDPKSTGGTFVSGPGDIPMVMLDSYNFKHVDLIKIDAEGFEKNILLGGENTVKTWKPVIIVENKVQKLKENFGTEGTPAVDLLLGWDYRLVQEISGDFIMARW